MSTPPPPSALIDDSRRWQQQRTSFTLDGGQTSAVSYSSPTTTMSSSIMSSLNPQTLSHKTASSNLDDQDDPHNIEWSSSSDEEESSLKVLAQGVKSVQALVSPGKGLLKKGIEDPSTAAASRKISIFQKALSPFSNKSRSTVEDDDADTSSAPPSTLLDPPPPPPPPPLPELTAVDLLASPAAPNASSDNWRWFTLRDLCARLCAGVNLGIRRRSNKSFSGAFTGDEATLWILSDEKNPATNEAEALQLAQALLDYGFIMRMSAHRQLHDVHLKHNKHNKKRFKPNSTVYKPQNVMVSPWRLHINIHSCTNLPSKSVISKALTGEIDPYIKLQLGDDEEKTKVVMNTNSPVFHEHFTFGLDDPASAQLKIRVNQYEAILEDTYLASAQLSLYSLPVRDASEGLVDQMKKCPPYLIQLRRDPMRKDPTDQATLKISMWLTKHTAPPTAMASTAIDAVLKAYVYSAEDVTDGHLAAFDMKIGTVLRIKWHNRVSMGVGQTKKPAYTRLTRKGKSHTDWNELIEMPVRINPLSDTVRFIVHQKGKHDLNERAIGAVTIPALNLPIHDPEHGNIVYPDPGAYEPDAQSTTPPPSPGGTPAKSPSPAPATPELLNPPNLRSSALASLKKVGLRATDHWGITSPANGSRDRSDAASSASTVLKTKHLVPKNLSLSTLAAVGSNRLIANGSLRVVVWLELKPQSNLLGDDCDETIPDIDNEPIAFPMSLKNECADEEVPIGYRRLRRAMLGTKSPFLNAFFDDQNFTEIEVGPWRCVPNEVGESSDTVDPANASSATWESVVGSPDFDGPLPESYTMTREITYVMPKSAMVKANKVTQLWKLSGLSARAFVMTQVTSTPEVPFGESFVTNCQYLCERRSEGSSWLGLSSEAEFLGKRPFVAGQIEGGVKNGTKDSLSAYVRLLKDAASGKKTEKSDRRGERGGEGGVRLGLLLLVVLSIWFFGIGWLMTGLRASGEFAKGCVVRVLLSEDERIRLARGVVIERRTGGGGEL